MRGRLLRWLRVIGVDSLLRDESESVVAMFERAAAQGRILITRDLRFAASIAEPVRNLMTNENHITVNVGVTHNDVRQLIAQNRIDTRIVLAYLSH